MAKTNLLFAVRDSKAEFYAPPFVKMSRGEAERDFQTLVRDEKSKIHMYPEDYDLFELGTYDENTGKIVPHDTPRHMMKAIDLKQK